MGMVFQICVGEDSETEKPERERKYKGRVVFEEMMWLMKIGT
jgi:hypothetical protein